MSLLAVYPNANPKNPEVIRDAAGISKRLNDIGVQFERWPTAAQLAEDAGQDEILAAYQEEVANLMATHGFKTADVISVGPDFPDKVALRQKFLAEHIHSEFEVRFFVGGKGLFFLHPDEHVYAVYCEQGDLISVPANTKHWFDSGAEPDIKAIRLFTNPEGWVAQYTGDDIADRLPKMDEFLEQCAASHA